MEELCQSLFCSFFHLKRVSHGDDVEKEKERDSGGKGGRIREQKDSEQQKQVSTSESLSFGHHTFRRFP